MSSVVVQSRVTHDIKNSATEILQKLGLSLSDFIRLSLTQLVKDKKFELELRLMQADNPEEYIVVENDDHLAELIDYKA